MSFLPGRSAAVPLHAAGELGLAPAQDRDHWWGRLSDQACRRIAASAGATVEWYAYGGDDLPYAVVLGANALVVWTPERLTAHRWVRRSLTDTRVRQRPSDAGPGGGLTASGPPPVDLGLSESMRGFLGNLPAEAQQRLQQPFVAADRVVAYEFFYYGNEEEMDVWCYLAGSSAVTFAAGHRKARRGAPPHAVAWDLKCYHAPLAAS
jgi:hypothetical protein